MKVSIGKKLYLYFVLVILVTVLLVNILPFALSRFPYANIFGGILAIFAGLVLAWAIARGITGELRSLAAAT